MTITDLKSRIEKAKEKIEKKTGTIVKKEGWIASGKKSEYEVHWLQDDIKRLHKEISETQKTVEKYERQLAGEIERESTLLKDVPESMKELQCQLVEKWNKYDLERKQELKKDYRELEYREFMDKHKYSGYEFMYKTDEQIERDNELDAKNLIIDLYYRINNITGDVTGWSELFCSGGVLNGFVTGKEGRASVNTILAGGYNIQRLHIRVLVHSVN